MGGFQKIPDNAQKVYSGILHSVYQWKQKMFDGSYQTFEAIKRSPSVTVIALTPAGKVLVVDEEQPYNGRFVTIPGGVAESDDLLSNARRELLEETGYESESWEHLVDIDVVPYAKLEWKSHFFIARNCRQTSKIAADPGERLTVREVTVSDFLTLIEREDFAIDYLKSVVADEARRSELKRLLAVAE